VLSERFPATLHPKLQKDGIRHKGSEKMNGR
jgi:hypothetical protein